MASGDRPDRKGHGEQRQPKGQGDTRKADAEVWKSSGQHGAPAATEYQPERSQKFCETTFAQSHKHLRLEQSALEAACGFVHHAGDLCNC